MSTTGPKLAKETKKKGGGKGGCALPHLPLQKKRKKRKGKKGGKRGGGEKKEGPLCSRP